MFKLTYKKILLGFFFAAVCTLAFFWREVLTFGVEKGLHYACHNMLDGCLESASVRMEEGGWVFEKPKFVGNKTIEEGGVHLSADRLKIKVIPSWAIFDTGLEIALQQPEINIKSADSDLSKLFDTLSSPAAAPINSKLRMERGVVAFHNFEGEDPAKQHIYFDLAAETGDVAKGNLILSLDDPELTKNCVHLNFSENGSDFIAIDLNFDEVDCTSLLVAATTLLPSLQDLTVTEGDVKGKMALRIPKSGKPYAIGDLQIQNLQYDLPRMEIRGKIAQAAIHFRETPDLQQVRGHPTTIGQIEIEKPSSISFDREGLPYCEVNNLLGSFYFETENNARIALSGTCEHHGQSSPLKIDGEAHFASDTDGSLFLNCRLEKNGGEPASAKFVTRQLGVKRKFAEISFNNIGPGEFDIIGALLAPHIPEAGQIYMTEGRIDASALAYLKGFRVTDIEVNHISARDLHFNLAPWRIQVDVALLSGKLKANLTAPKVWETINADLLLDKGHIFSKGNEEGLLRLTDMKASVTVQNGTVMKSTIEGIFAGLRGRIDVDGMQANGEIARILFSGQAKDLATFAQAKTGVHIGKRFSDDALKLSALVTKKNSGLVMKGEVALTSNSGSHVDSLAFGCDIEQTSRKLWGRWPVAHQAAEYWHEIGLEASMSAMPVLASPAGLMMTTWMRRELGIAGFVLRNGWFEGNNLDLSKFVEPFVFPDNDVRLTGTGNFKGTFDHREATLHYDLTDASVDNSDLTMDVKEIKGAVHHFDFTQDDAFGRVQMHKGRYFEKNSGLLFSDFDALVTLNGKKIDVTDLKAVTNGIVFEGKVHFDLTSPEKGNFDAIVDASSIRGTFAELKQVFSHFGKLKFFEKFPLDGNIVFTPEGNRMEMFFRPGDFSLKTQLKGTFSNGKTDEGSWDAGVKNLAFSFEYDQEKSTFDISDIEGSLVLGKGDQREEFSVAGEQISFTNLDRNEAVFDLWVGDKTRDLLRLSGRTGISAHGNRHDDLITFYFDNKLTHLGNIHPKKADLVLTNWSQVHTFRLECDLSLAALLHEVRLLSRTGLACLPKTFQDSLNTAQSAEGDLKLSMHYDEKSSLFTYHLSGDNLAAGPYKFQKCTLHGKKKNCTWAIDQLQLDDWTLATDIVRQPEGWKVNFLGLRYGEGLLMGLDGEYNDTHSTLSGKINLLEVNIAKLDGIPALKPFLEGYSPEGLLRGTGTFSTQPTAAGAFGRIEAQVNGSLRSWGFRGMTFQDSAHSSWHYDSDKGLTVGDLDAHLVSGNNVSLAALKGGSILYNKERDILKVDGLHFSIPIQTLPETLTQMRRAFPETFSDKSAELIAKLKREGSLDGSFAMESSPYDRFALISLNDGLYHFNNNDHLVDNFRLRIDHEELALASGYQFEKQHFKLAARSSAPDFNKGEIVLSDDAQSPEVLPCTVLWTNDPQLGFLIHSAKGHVAGLDINLAANRDIPLDNEANYLSGSVHLNPGKCAGLISGELLEKAAAWDLGPGYTLKGQWVLGKKDYHEDTNQIYFHGHLEGKEFRAKGYIFDKMTAHVNLAPGAIEVHNLQVYDPAGTVQIDKIDIYKAHDDKWYLSVPKVTAKEFRPSLLNEVEPDMPQVSKPLVVSLMEIDSIQGCLDDCNTLTGKGKLVFSNRPKKNLQNTIFAIPAEILTRIGLNLTVLNPVSGTIFFEVKDGRYNLSKFKDVYSDGKHSKFFLSNSSGPSYVDFDGNLHVRIRMRQYNLFFKLAELFTVSVGGTLQKPTYSLRKQQDEEK